MHAASTTIEIESHSAGMMMRSIFSSAFRFSLHAPIGTGKPSFSVVGPPLDASPTPAGAPESPDPLGYHPRLPQSRRRRSRPLTRAEQAR